jgi:elongation factor G
MFSDIPINRLRNLGILAHIDAGKTTCTERVLFYTGVVDRPGDVDDGNTTTDFREEEQRRGITIFAAAVTARWKPIYGANSGQVHELRIIDTPGHIDFAIEVERSLRVLDGAVFLLDAGSGVECQSESVWRQAERHGVPRITFVNKMDKLGASFERCLDDMRDRLEARPLPIQLPLGEEAEHRGVIDLVRMRCVVFGDSDRRELREEPIPEELETWVFAARTRLVEACAEADDDVLHAWSHGKNPDPIALERALRELALSGSAHLVTCGSAQRYRGIQALLDAVVAYLPAPNDRRAEAGRTPDGHEISCPAEVSAPLAALAFKIESDARGTFTFLRVYSGRLRRGDRVVTASGPTRVGRLYVVSAAERHEVEEARAGDIVAALGLDRVHSGDTLSSVEQPISLETITVPEPVLEVTLEPKESRDRERLSGALSRLLRDDPSLALRVNEETGETVLLAMGQLHVSVVESRLQREHGVHVRLGQPSVAYRDTLARGASIDHRHVRQTGGPGQFAHVVIEFSPAERGSGVQFIDDTSGGVIPAAFVPAVGVGIRSFASRGLRHGHPIVDVVARLVDGAFHVKDSSSIAFEIAGAHALRQAAEETGLVLLEPVMAVSVTLPEAHLGDVMGDLVSRRGTIRNVGVRGTRSLIEASVPLASLFDWVSNLRSLTHGRGDVAMTPERYDRVPERVAKAVLAA